MKATRKNLKPQRRKYQYWWYGETCIRRLSEIEKINTGGTGELAFEVVPAVEVRDVHRMLPLPEEGSVLLSTAQKTHVSRQHILKNQEQDHVT